MTLALLIKVTDGLVLAADSATTIGESGTGNVYNNADKLFRLHKDARIGTIMWGLGSMRGATVTFHLKQLRERLAGGDKKWKIDAKNHTVEDVARKVQQFLYSEIYRPWFEASSPPIPKAEWPWFGIIVAGYSTQKDIAEAWRLDVFEGEPRLTQVSSPEDPTGIFWGGDGEAVQRLVLGYDHRIPRALAEELGAVDDASEGPLSTALIRDAFRRAAAKLEANVLPPWMPIQDAIDLAGFLVDTASKYSRYTPGYQTIGGPIDIAAITKYEGFKWVRRKHYFDAKLNP